MVQALVVGVGSSGLMVAAAGGVLWHTARTRRDIDHKR